MPEDRSRKQQLSPGVSATIIAIAFYALTVYQTGQLLRPIVAAMLGGSGAYLIILLGLRRAEHQSSGSAIAERGEVNADARPETTRKGGAWLRIAMGVILIAVIAVPVGLVIRNETAKADALAAEKKRLAEKATDDAEVRKRKFQMHFWKDFSGSEERIRDHIKAKIEDGTISILSFELNAPSGPAEVIYEGDASKARHIQETIRWTGVPSASYGFVDAAD